MKEKIGKHKCMSKSSLIQELFQKEWFLKVFARFLSYKQN